MIPHNPIAERQAQLREIVEAGVAPLDLHAIANGPIMDPRVIFLPAGKLSPEQADARQTRILAGLPC